MQIAMNFELLLMGILSQQGDTCCAEQVHLSSLGARKPEIRRHVISGTRRRVWMVLLS